MKLGIYLKESWYNLRKDRVYSAVYIIGTGLSLALVTAWLTVQSMHFDNAYPETHRDRMLIVGALMESSLDGETNSTAMLSADFVDRFLKEPIEGVEDVTAFCFGQVAVSNESGEGMTAVVEYVDDEFWKVFGFDFVSGRAFSMKDMNRTAPEAVISESAARMIFGHADVVGETLFSPEGQFRICGVVRDAPKTAAYAFSQIWAADVNRGESDASTFAWLGRESMLGDYMAVVLAEDRIRFDIIRAEIEDRLSRYNSSEGVEYTLSMHMGIPSVKESAFMWTGFTSGTYTWIGIGIMAFVLLVPMINLSGMVGSRTEARMGEFGVRKSFGAWKSDILGQITGENLLLTFFGGLLGLVLSWILLGAFSEQFNSLVPAETIALVWAEGDVEGALFSVRDFFSLKLYLILLLIVLALNMLSSLLPAMKVIRRPITESLNYNK